MAPSADRETKDDLGVQNSVFGRAVSVGREKNYIRRRRSGGALF